MSTFTDADRAMLTKVLALLEARPAATPAPVAAVADDRDLDSQWGDPPIKKDPPRWTGPSYVGRHLSECPPEYLDAFAALCDWKVSKDEQKGDEQALKYAHYARKDAARARGWAKRLRDGWKKTSAFDALPSGADSDVPF